MSAAEESAGKGFPLACVPLGVVLYTPLTGIMGRLLLFVSGRTVADTDILFFVMTPLGMAGLMLFGALPVTTVVFEKASILVICAGNFRENTPEDVNGG